MHRNNGKALALHILRGESDVACVGRVEGHLEIAQYAWRTEYGLDQNFRMVGRLLRSLNLDLYRAADGGGLLHVEGGKVHRIATAKDLGPLLIDHIRIKITKLGKLHGEKVSDSTLNNMLFSKTFLSAFQTVEAVVTTPVVLADLTLSQPGFNAQGGILHVGPAASPVTGMDTTNRFLDVMDWATNADRTNAVAAGLSVHFRYHFPGGKPLILVTSTKSHAGKGTAVEFVRGRTSKAEILYEHIDWPMEKSLQSQLLKCPEIGIINIDNARLDSAGGRGKIIRSGFLESFITNSEILLNSTGLKPVRTVNNYVVLLNTNEGSLSIDLLNRALPIRLAPTGDVIHRKSPIGNPKLEFLPAHRHQIDAELWGMVERWRKEGKPLDESKVQYPMSGWAKTIGGILRVNGFTDFLGNYAATRAAADPIREALSILAFNGSGKPMRARELAIIAASQGLAKILLAGAEPANEAACERQMGVILTPYVGETFTAVTATEMISYRLKKENRRWNGAKPHYRYIFEEVGRTPASEDALRGLVLEDLPTDIDGLGNEPNPHDGI